MTCAYCCSFAGRQARAAGLELRGWGVCCSPGGLPGVSHLSGSRMLLRSSCMKACRCLPLCCLAAAQVPSIPSGGGCQEYQHGVRGQHDFDMCAGQMPSS